MFVVHTCNAAGLGKTTIAHVVARHCGYRPFEINASDDRTATALQSRIQDAVQMQSVLGKRQMNLVIVDEVDGIAGATVPCNSLFNCMLNDTLVLERCCKTPNYLYVACWLCLLLEPNSICTPQGFVRD